MNSGSLKLNCKSGDCGKAFLVIAKEHQFYQRKNLPLPNHCPACRHKLRMAIRGERQLYKRKCACCGENMLSTYPPEAPYAIYCHKCFWENIG